MRSIKCRGEVREDCPVTAWLNDGFDSEHVPDGVIRHGYDRDREQRYRCTTCERMFTVAATHGSVHQLPNGLSSFREYLQLELAWGVTCHGVKLNTAARVAGVDWATARRWRDRAQKRWGEALCTTLDAVDVQEDMRSRVFGTTDIGSDGSMTDERWMRAASAAMLLFRARQMHVISASRYRELWWLRDRSRTFEPAWDQAMRDLRFELKLAAPPQPR